MEYLIAFLLFVLVPYILYSLGFKYNGRRLPPGPLGIPILGHLHLLGELPHRNLAKLAEKYGPIMHIRLGLVPAIVVSTPEAAEPFLKTHDLVFASRPKLQAAEYISYGQRNVAFGKYGPRWRNLRKLCTLELLTVSKIESFESSRKEDVKCFVKGIVKAAEACAVVDVSSKVGSLIEDMTLQLIIGRGKGDILGFKSSVEEIMALHGAFNVADYVPFLGAFDLQGLSRRMKAVSKVLDGFLETIIDEHTRDTSKRKGQHGDFIDAMLYLMEYNNGLVEQLDRDTIKAVTIDMIGGSMDTSTTAIEWVVTELLRHPRVMKLVQLELQNVVGMVRMVDESDLPKLYYLDSVIKESMRLHPVAPLLIPHEAREDININGYYIPKKSRVIINSWAIGHDPQVWSANVEEFYPERFTGTKMDFSGHDLRFIPFGSGRRGCPAMQLGLTVVRLVIAQLVHCFNWELPNAMSSQDLDMSEKFGLSMPRAKHLLATPTFRLHFHIL